MQLVSGRTGPFARGSFALAAALGLLVLGGCASSDEGTFDPGTGGTPVDSGVGDAKTDAKPDSGSCNLAACPTPPGEAQKCCANGNTCGYQAGMLCYPLKDGGGGTGGGSP